MIMFFSYSNKILCVQEKVFISARKKQIYTETSEIRLKITKTILSCRSFICKSGSEAALSKNCSTLSKTQVSSCERSFDEKSSNEVSYISVKTLVELFSLRVAPFENIGRMSGLPHDQVYRDWLNNVSKIWRYIYNFNSSFWCASYYIGNLCGCNTNNIKKLLWHWKEEVFIFLYHS